MKLKKGDIVIRKFGEGYYIGEINYTYTQHKDILWANMNILKAEPCWAFPRSDNQIIGMNNKIWDDIKKINPIKKRWLRYRYGKDRR